MYNIMITGVAGLVGSNIAKKLVNDHNIIGVDNLIGGYKDNIPKGIKFYEIDCNNLTIEHFKNIDIVVHAACTAHEGLSVFSPKMITDNTYSQSVNVLTLAIQAGVKKFVFTSSMARYGKQDIVPFTEDMLPNPQDPYGVAKLAFEKTLQSIADVHGIEYSILIPHNIIGEGQVYTDPFRNVAAIMINRMLQGKQPIIYGDGNQMRCFSDINDIIDPLYKVILTDVGNSEIINIGPDSNYITINELAKKIANILNFDLFPIYLPGRPKEVKYANCSADKARKLLNYNPQTSIEDTLSKMIDWVSKRGTSQFNFSLPIEIKNSKIPQTWINQEIFNS
jgi:UDP-glucose 4-epimerase